jgi:hypothetical protein
MKVEVTNQEDKASLHCGGGPFSPSASRCLSLKLSC